MVAVTYGHARVPVRIEEAPALRVQEQCVRGVPAIHYRHPARVLASPSELSVSPSELVASPSELLASPSELVASPSEL
jgi:hypothetical protein